MIPTPTNGIGCQSRVVITSSSPTLVLVGAEQNLTYQVVAQVTDNFGTVIPDVELYYNIVAGNDVAEISDSGLLNATDPGQVVIQVSAAAFGNRINLFTVDGIPINAIYSEQTLQVVEGVPLYPDFSFTISSSTLALGTTDTQTITITQTALHGFTGTVNYSFYPNGGTLSSWNGYQRSFIPGGASITESGTATLTFQTSASPMGSVNGQVYGSAPTQAYALPPGATDGALAHSKSLTITVS